MFERDINFCDDLEEQVDIFTKTGKKVGVGTLYLVSGQLPKVEFSGYFDFKKYKDNTLFVCKSLDNTYSLINCMVYQRIMYPKLIVTSKKANGRFKKISVLMRGVSEWMDDTSGSGVTDNELKKEMEHKTFSVSVKESDSRTLSISNENWWQSKRKGNDFVVSHYSIITFEATKGTFSAEDVITKTNEIVTIFSLLLAFPVSVEYVFDRSKKGNRSSIYFVNNADKKSDFKEKHDCLNTSKWLFENNKWQEVITNFYEKQDGDNRRNCSVLSGMLSFQGYLEHEIFAYVSLLERCVTRDIKSFEEKMSKKDFNNLKEKITDVLEDGDVERSNQDMLVIKSLVEQVTHLKNTNIVTFRDSFDIFMGGVSRDIKNIIGFNESDFVHLKKLRDKVAHGDKVKTKEISNVTYEVQLGAKVFVLLLYVFYRRLGFSDDDFIRVLSMGRFNRMVMEANLHQEAIDHCLGHYLYFNLNKTDFLKATIKKNRGTVVLEYKEKTGKYILHSGGTAIALEWQRNHSDYKCIEDCLSSNLDDSSLKSISYIGSAYLQNADEKYRVNSLLVLNCLDSIASHDRTKRYSVSQDRWT